MRVILSGRAKKCDGRVSNEFQQSHEGSFFGKEKRKKKSAKGDFLGFVLFCLYISQVCYKTLLNEREGWTRKSEQG